jgi:beta-lactamase regulating signal transducer with metallopeptidase domain
MATTTSLSLPLLAQEFVTEVSQKHNQKVKVLRKSKSWLMRAIGFILKPFNPTFMEQYITTIGATIYVPDDFLTSFGEMEILDVLAHETQHVIDFTKNRKR